MIMNFEEYSQINEAGNTPENIHWVKSDTRWDGKFQLGEDSFDIYFTKENQYCDLVDIWEVKLRKNQSTKTAGDFKWQFRIVPTVRAAMDHFISSIEPEVLGWVGELERDINNKPTNLGRIRMYDKDSMRYASKYGYKNITHPRGDYFGFVLYKNEEIVHCIDELESMKKTEH